MRLLAKPGLLWLTLDEKPAAVAVLRRLGYRRERGEFSKSLKARSEVGDFFTADGKVCITETIAKTGFAEEGAFYVDADRIPADHLEEIRAAVIAFQAQVPAISSPRLGPQR